MFGRKKTEVNSSENYSSVKTSNEFRELGDQFVIRPSGDYEIDYWINEHLKITNPSKYSMIYNMSANDSTDKTMLFKVIPQSTIIGVYTVLKEISVNDQMIQSFITPNFDLLIFRTDGCANLVVDGQLYDNTPLDRKISDIWHNDFVKAKNYQKN